MFDISIIVPTCNRRGALVRLLNSLTEQRPNGLTFEVLVVDNNSHDGTADTVASFDPRGRFTLRYLHEPRPGVSHARNTGVAHATAPILAFLDDDVEAAPDWVATVKRTLDEHPEVDCIGGPVRPQWPCAPPRWLTSAHWSPVALQEKRPWMYLNAENASSCLATENFACKPDAFHAVGGFDPTFVRAQDREFQLRLWSAGKQGLYTPELVVTTEVPRDRMNKAYHRKWYQTQGRFLAIMRYHDRIDPGGRLVGERADMPKFLGSPLFLYREVLRHFAGWFWATVTLRGNSAFYHETRLRRFVSFILTRYRMEYGSASVRSHLADIGQVFRRRLAPRTSRSRQRT